MNSLVDFFSSASISTEPNGSLLIQSSHGRIVLWVLAFLVLVPVSFVLLRIGGFFKRFAIAGFVVSLAILILVIPAVVTEKVDVSKDHFIVKTGFWFAPTGEDLDLDGLACIHEQREVVREGRMNESHVVWQFEWHDGRTRDLVLRTCWLPTSRRLSTIWKIRASISPRPPTRRARTRAPILPPLFILPRPENMGMGAIAAPGKTPSMRRGAIAMLRMPG